MEVKTTLYNHMKEQIDSIKDENIRLSEKVHVRKIRSNVSHQDCCFFQLAGNVSK